MNIFRSSIWAAWKRGVYRIKKTYCYHSNECPLICVNSFQNKKFKIRFIPCQSNILAFHYPIFFSVHVGSSHHKDPLIKFSSRDILFLQAQLVKKYHSFVILKEKLKKKNQKQLKRDCISLIYTKALFKIYSVKFDQISTHHSE